MRKIFLIHTLILPGIFLMLSAFVHSQTFRVTGTIRNSETGEAIPGATVRATGVLGVGCISDTAGKYSLPLEEAGVLLEVSALGYEKYWFKIEKARDQVVPFQLTPRDIVTDEVVITAEVIEKVFDDKLHLYDFEFSGEDLFVVMYDRKAKRPVLALVNERDSVLDTAWCVEPPGRLARDCMGNLYTFTRHTANHIWLENGEIRLQAYSTEYFENQIQPCLVSIDEFFYFRQYQLNNQILRYYGYNTVKELWFELPAVMDNNKIHQIMDPMGIYAGIGKKREDFLRLSERDWQEIAKINPEFMFEANAFFYPVDAPMFNAGRELLVFDHLNRKIQKLKPSGDLKSEVPVTYPDEPHWQRIILMDEVRQEAYTILEQSGIRTLREIDLSTGALLPGEYKIPMPFSKKITVHNGVIYFLYRDPVYDDTNRLYRWRIK